MEADEVEMSKAQLQSLIRGQVQKTLLSSSALNEKFDLLRSLLSRKQRQIKKLSTICQSVAKCEETVKELYSLLGWEYEDEDSDKDDAEPSGFSRVQPLLFVPSGHHIHNTPPFQPSPQSSELDDEEMKERHNDCKSSVIVKTNAVVVLTKLRRSQIAAALRAPSPRPDSSKETFIRAESDVEYVPETDSSDSDFSLSDFNIGPNKRRKIAQNNRKCRRTKQTSQRGRNVDTISGSKTPTGTAGTTSTTECDGMERSPVKATPDTDAKNNTTEATALQADTTKTTIQFEKSKTPQSNVSKTVPQATPTSSQTNTTKSTPQSNTKPGPQSNISKTSTLSADMNGGTVTGQPQTTSSSPPKVPRVEITVNMNILARKKTLSWKPGKIAAMITKGDGKVKYKVVFEQGKCLVSSHHIALNTVPQMDYLVIGARVVVKCEGDPTDFKPGILAETPSRKNRMRFLVFIDDHTPVYCNLPSLRLVCNPLTDPLDDIPDENHRSYMREYLKAWPYPAVTQYQVGRMVNVEYNGVQQKCEVLETDCSLIKVIFTCDQQKEWIFRGSMRLENIVNMRKAILTNMNGKNNKNLS